MADENLLTVLHGLQKSIALGQLRAVAISVVTEDDTTNLFYYRDEEALTYMAVSHAIQAGEILNECKKEGRSDEIGLTGGSA
jgi:hypothetical protein